ncbi:precorrin-2 C(20)-methyltransferase [Acidaminobacter sp. JC074]|uniref:precorrin-2 C(20)-methyltransferase n=1 Tax=Acidaminobacter sp. JC074 TaxID=2530199 RepID=UPI001F0E763E|nr:precorrin-2 C(20)-methyltransferase [Acidaminobacter sp. JC074]MCH4888266.1 precorrin-2 C(20)-methyltransferase [Acidaminobacter sp. JC074]
MKTKLYGIGVGPGDPEYLTLKAKRIMNSVDVLICPSKSEDAESFAYEIVKPNMENKDVEVLKMIFPMHYKTHDLKKKWAENGKVISDLLSQGKTCGFITLGDPTVYSTFIYTLPYIDDAVMDLELIPGITSFCAVASEIKQPLMVWEESLKVMPVRKNSKDHLIQAVGEHDNLVLMKPSSDTQAIVEAIRHHGLENNFMLISKVGTEGSHMIRDIEVLENTKLPYLSTMIIKKGGFRD